MEFGLDEEAHEQAVVKSSDELNVIAKLLGTRPKQLEAALCYRVVAAKGEVLEKGHNEKEAYHGRDALAKVSCAERVGRVCRSSNLCYAPLTGLNAKEVACHNRERAP